MDSDLTVQDAPGTPGAGGKKHGCEEDEERGEAQGHEAEGCLAVARELTTMAKKRLSISLPEGDYVSLKELADESHRSMTDVIRTALGLAKIALEEEKKNRRMAVVEKDTEKVLKEILLP